MLKETTTFGAVGTSVVETNAHIHIPAGHVGQVLPRSSMSRDGWLIHTGTIDHGYSGNIKVTITNLSTHPRQLDAGDRIAQIIFQPFTALEMEEVDQMQDFVDQVYEDSKSDRGTDGYGSSGRK